MRLVLLGPPGVGKGTQAKVLKGRLDVPHISTGEIFRQHMRSGSEFGRKVKEITDGGNLVPDSIVIEIVADRLGRDDIREKGFLLDGFPRTLPQGEALDRWLDANGLPLDRVVEIDAPPEILVRRLAGRRHCAGCGADFNMEFRPPKVPGRCDGCGGILMSRTDDTPDSVRRRLEVDATETRPLRDFYGRRGLLCSVDGSLRPSVVTETILGRLSVA